MSGLQNVIAMFTNERPRGTYQSKIIQCFFIIKYSFLSMAVIMTSIVMDSKTIRKHAIIIIILQGGRGKLFIILVPKVV